MTVRVRFAPSPTGHVHIGNIRAAIFNWLFARHEGGKFLLRVEDTDLERSTPAAIETLLDVMRWLALDFDEEIVYQTKQLATHLAAAKRLEAEGKAYYLSRKPEEPPALYFRIPCGSDMPESIRTAGPVSVALHPDTPVVVDRGGLSFAQISKKNKPVPTESCLAGVKDMRLFAGDGACLFDLNAHLAAILSGAESFTFDKAVRMEFVRREVLFQDVVKGTLAKPLDGMKDLVIVRSNGAPVFHLANVCDDIAQGITHIIRGDDHVENTYRHVLLFHALGATPPRYAHLPMIVNKDGKPYSKRDGDAYVGDFREKGYFADALFNYLTLLGWSPGDDKEKMTREEAVRLFTLARIKSGPAQMDLRKLTDLNRQYVSEMPEEAFVEAAGKAIRANAWAQSLDPAYFRRVCRLLQTRTPLFSVTRDWKYFFTDAVDYDPVSVEKILKKEGVGRVLKALRERLDGAAFTLREIEAAIRETEGQFNIPEGRLNQPIRIAVTGVAQGAGIYETMAVLGKEKSLKRLGHAITHVCGAVA